MTSLLPATELGAFAVRALERPGPNDWMALIVPRADVEQTAKELTEELSVIGDIEAVGRSVPTAPSLVAFVHTHPEGILVLSGLDGFGTADWEFLDGERSRLQRSGTSLLVLGEESFGQLIGHAPNLASWLGGGAWRLERKASSLSVEGREARLEALRKWAGRTDAEVVAQAEQGQLPRDPPFAEWLVLLGRGDLLGE